MLAADFARALGTIPGWLTLVSLAVVGYYVVRGQAGPALTIMRETNRVLTERVQDLEAQLAVNRSRITELEGTRSLEVIGEQITAAFDAQRERAERRLDAVLGEAHEHERRAQERHEAQLELTRNVSAEVVAALRDASNGSG
jgi:TolA-binding protein